MKTRAIPNAYTPSRRNRPLPAIWIRRAAGNSRRGLLAAGGRTIQLALGRGGVRANKREGDGGTPRGQFFPVRVWWRADRVPQPRTPLPIRRIGPADAWCEDPTDRRYNRAFGRSASEPGDRLWRHDGLYDLFIEIDHNTKPRIAGRGSAVFIHVARSGFAPTAGCVALRLPDLQKLVSRLGPKTRIMIHN